MPTENDVQLPYGNVWQVGSWITTEGAQIVIPVDQISGFSVEEIGEQVVALIPAARRLHAEELAEMVNHQWNVRKELRIRGDEVHYERFLKCRPYLADFAESDDAIRDALDLVDKYIARVEEDRRLAERRKPAIVIQQRQIVAANYDKLFVQIGRRDGFSCAKCSAVRDLQIDPIIPVSAGGGSGLENLQILCRACNMDKGTQTVDYRPKGES